MGRRTLGRIPGFPKTEPDVMLTAAGAIIPDVNGADKSKVEGPNFAYSAIGYDPLVQQRAYWGFIAPETLNQITASISWLSAGLGGAVRWRISSLSRTAGDVWSDDFTASVEVTGAQVAPGLVNVTTVVVPIVNCVAEDVVQFRVQRLATDAADTLDDDAWLLHIELVI